MDQAEAALTLEQRRRLLLGILAALEQQQAAVRAEQHPLLDWQEKLRQGLEHWATRGAVLAQMAQLAQLGAALPAETLPTDLRSVQQNLATLHTDLQHDQAAIDELMPKLLRAESQLSSLLMQVDQLTQGYEHLRQEMLALYEQTTDRRGSRP